MRKIALSFEVLTQISFNSESIGDIILLTLSLSFILSGPMEEVSVAESMDTNCAVATEVVSAKNQVSVVSATNIGFRGESVNGPKSLRLTNLKCGWSNNCGRAFA